MPHPTWVATLADYIHPFLATVYNLLMTTCQVTKLKLSQIGFLNITMRSLYSGGLHHHQISVQESIFGIWRNENFRSWMYNEQICSISVMLSYQYGTKNLFLMKWMVSFCSLFFLFCFFTANGIKVMGRNSWGILDKCHRTSVDSGAPLWWDLATAWTGA